jgi:hypothetical protein
MSKDDLTSEQRAEADHIDNIIEQLSNLKDKFKDYKLGDFYIREKFDPLSPKTKWVEKTHTGSPVKYKVVYITKSGIPYFRQITRTGNTTGAAIQPRELNTGALAMVGRSFNPINHGLVSERFVQDPDQLDAILLQEEFDPMAEHAEKSRLFNEINKHNKEAMIPTGWSNLEDIKKFFKSLTPGDKFWTSPEKQFIIQSVAKQGREYVITATNINKETKTFSFSYFQHKRLYKTQPRSYKKESTK